MTYQWITSVTTMLALASQPSEIVNFNDGINFGELSVIRNDFRTYGGDYRSGGRDCEISGREIKSCGRQFGTCGRQLGTCGRQSRVPLPVFMRERRENKTQLSNWKFGVRRQRRRFGFLNTVDASESKAASRLRLPLHSKKARRHCSQPSRGCEVCGNKRRPNSFRVAPSRNEMRCPRVAKAQPWAGIGERFQRYSPTNLLKSGYRFDFLCKAGPVVTNYTAVYLSTIHPFRRTVANHDKRGIASFSWIRGIQNHVT